MQENTADKLRAQGVQVETVGDLLGGQQQAEAGPQRFTPATLDGTPALPTPGIYFGMPDDLYHSLPACSNSGIKKLAASPMIFWAATPWLSERKRRKVEEAKAGGEREHFVMGRAYHCRLLEGASAYAMRYATALDPADFPDALVSTDQIKAAIGAFETSQPVKPAGTKAEMIAQLAALAAPDDPFADADQTQFDDGTKVDVVGLKQRIGAFTEMVPVKPVSKVPDELPDGTPYQRQAVKEDWITQLLALDPEAQVFADLDAAHRAKHDGKVFLSPDQHGELEIAAAMVERDPELREAFKYGYPEVTLIWYCPKTGVPMKARVDYLKTKAMVDLKSVGNQRERSIENAIRWEIASYHYNLQPVVYGEGAKIVRQLVRDHGVSAIHVNEAVYPDAGTVQTFALRWAQHMEPDEWLFVFQMKGEAPITRGVWWPRGGTTDMITGDIIAQAKRRFRTCSECYDTSPWLDVKPPYQLADEDVPPQATEI